MRIRITLLDGVQVHRDGQPVALGPPQRRALLAMLAMRRRRWISATTLLDGLYDDGGPASGVGLVQTHISALRRALEPDRLPRAAPTVLLSGHGGYQLNITDEQVDVGVFDRLVSEAEQARAQGDPKVADQRYAEALRLCAGDPLAGVPGPVAAAYRAVLRERALAVLEDSLLVALSLGRTDQVIEQARPLVSEYPLRERAGAILMRALDRQGRRAQALEVYTRTRRHLIDELGVEPGEELRDLQARILAGRAEPLGTAAFRASTRAGSGSDTGARASSDSPSGPNLVLDRIDEPGSRAADPQGSPSVRLGSNTATGVAPNSFGGNGARPGRAGFAPATTISAAPLLERDEQLAAVLRAYERAMSGSGGTVVVSGYPGSGKTALLEVARRQLPQAVSLTVADLTGPEPRLFRALAAIAGIDGTAGEIDLADPRGQAMILRDGLAGERRLLLIDDIAEAGTPSLELLVALTPLLRDLPVLVVAVFDERTWYPIPVSTAHTDLECAAVEVIRLGGLRSAAISVLAERALGRACPDELALEVQQATGGLPILVDALLKDLALLDDPRHVPEQLPGGTYLRAVRRLLGRYSRDGGAMLRAIAVLQDYAAPIGVIAAASEQSESEIRERCELLVIEGILAVADPPRFRHRLPANTLRRLCPREEVQQVRESAARRALLISRDSREVARYLRELSGPQWSNWVPTLIDAAGEAVRALDLAEATGYLEVAQRICAPEQRADIALRLGLLKQWTDPVAAHAYLEQALTLERAAKAAPAALIPLVWTLITSQRAAEADALLDQVLAETTARDPEAATSVRASRWMVAALTSRTWSDYRESAWADPVPDAVTAATRTLDDVFAVRISAQEARARFLPAGGAEPTERLPRELFGIFAHIALWADELTLTAQLSDQSEDKYFGAIDVYRLILRSEALIRQGRYAAAERECALIAATPTGSVVRRPAALVAQYAHALLGSGRIEEAEQWLESTRAHTNPESWEWTNITYVRALCCVARGRTREAVALFLECGRRLSAWNLRNPAFIPWRSAAALQLVELGDHDQARALAAAELELAQRWNTPVTLGRAWRAVALAAADDTTIDLLRTAISQLRRGESATELIRAQIDLADVLRASGLSSRARTTLEQARGLSIARGAALFTARIDDRLAALGTVSSPSGQPAR